MTKLFWNSVGYFAVQEANFERHIAQMAGIDKPYPRELLAWLQAIADRAACGLVSLQGSTLFPDSLALEVKKYIFPDVLTSWAPKSDAPEAPLEPDSPGDSGA